MLAKTIAFHCGNWHKALAMETNLQFYYYSSFFLNLMWSLHGVMAACSTLEVGVMGSNPAEGTFFSSQVAVFMQNLGLIMIKNHELYSSANFCKLGLVMGETYKLVRPICT